MPDVISRRILSIDGGGIKGVFPISFLATLEQATSGRIVDHFDLITGTSTGGIIALGLGLGYSAAEVLEFYEQLGPQVFAGSRLVRAVRWMGFSKYDSGPLKRALESKFRERRLGESRTRLVIPATNLETGEVHVYKTAHHPRFERDYLERAVDVALATAAAPTYFPTHSTAAGAPLIDGGVWAINPVGVAVVEAVGVLEWPRESLRVLSLGCTSEPLDFGLARKVGLGLGPWAVNGVQVFLAAQSSGALGTAYTLVGHDNVVRVNPIVPRGRFGLDKLTEIPSLRGLGESEARKALPRVREMFFYGPKEPFEPFHRL